MLLHRFSIFRKLLQVDFIQERFFYFLISLFFRHLILLIEVGERLCPLSMKTPGRCIRRDTPALQRHVVLLMMEIESQPQAVAETSVRALSVEGDSDADLVTWMTLREEDEETCTFVARLVSAKCRQYLRRGSRGFRECDF